MMLLLRVSWGGDQAWSSCRKPRPCTKTQLNQPPDKYSIYIQAYQSNTPGFSTWFNQLLFLTSLFREDYQTGFNFIWEATGTTGFRILNCFLLVLCDPKGISLDEGTHLALIVMVHPMEGADRWYDWTYISTYFHDTFALLNVIPF